MRQIQRHLDAARAYRVAHAHITRRLPDFTHDGIVDLEDLVDDCLWECGHVVGEDLAWQVASELTEE